MDENDNLSNQLQKSIEPETTPVKVATEPVQPEPTPEEPKKRKLRRGTIPKLILSVLLFVAGILLIIWGIKYDGEEELPGNDTNETIDPLPIDDNTTMELEENTKVFLAEKTLQPDEEIPDQHLLVLRPDGTFIYSSSVEYGFAPLVGNYSIKGEDITLDVVVKYGSDACFFKDNWNKQYKGKYIEDTIDITIEDETILFKVGELPKTVKYNDKWYVTNPTDGVMPEGSMEETWIDCDKIVN